MANKKHYFKGILTKDKVLFQAGLFFVFSLFTILIVGIYNNEIGNGVSQSKIQNTIFDIESSMNNTFENIENRLAQTSSNFQFNQSDLLNSQSSGINYFVFKDDSIIAWSDNEVIPKPNKSTTKQAYVAKLDDGFYFCKSVTKAPYTIIAIYLLEHKYPFENEHLINEINPSFNIHKVLQFQFDSIASDYSIRNIEGSYLFNIDFDKSPKLKASQSVIVFILYFLSLSLLYSFVFVLLKRKFKKLRLVLLFGVLVIGIRVLLQLLAWPAILYSSIIFDPASFAVSYIFPSLGDLFLSVFSVFLIILVAHRELKIEVQEGQSKLINSILHIVILIIGFGIYLGSLGLIRKLILNSSINFDVSNLFGLNFLSLIGLIVIIGILFSFLLFLYDLSKASRQLIPQKLNLLIVTLSTFILLSLFNYFYSHLSISLLSLFFILILVLQFKNSNTSFYSLANMLPVLLILSFISSISMNSDVYEAEHLKRQSIARSVAINQDPQVEYLFHEVEKQIYNDSILLVDFHDNTISLDSISNYIIQKYFSQDVHWSKYDLQATICDNSQELVIKPDNIRVLCSDFFYKNLIAYGSLTTNKNLYHLQYGTGQINYLGLFQFVEHTLEGDITYTIYLEINSKLKRKGFTKLLNEKGNDPFEKLQNYSLATYHKDTLIENYGIYSYPEFLDPNIKTKEEMLFVDRNGFNHLVYRNNDSDYYILSKKIPEKLTTIASFSYLFILFALVFLVFSFLFKGSFINWTFEANFTDRLQLTMIAIIIVSFSMISYFSAHYIISLNNEKNNQTLKNLSSSLQMEFEHKVSNINVSENEYNKDYLQTLSNKFAKVFDTDINLYNLNGDLISSTRPGIFEKHLLSEKINPRAYYKLSVEKESFYVTQENIGRLVYSSAYLPFHNSRQEIVAYLNLPYFARQRELQNEVSSFLMTLMNVYTFIIVLSIIVILLISNYISRPLRMIKEKLQKLTLGASNEKIEWKAEDEIGRLVMEYNRMVDQMAIKADLLAKSERESAWREMAKQVAHEIKNPLTPMKLSVQYLLRSWNEKDPDWEDRLYRLSETLIEQIDTLSDIATAFSDFAKMPKSSNEKIELNEIITNAIELYADFENLQINFKADSSREMYIYADRKQLLRVFNNLIKNSIQSFEINQTGFIDIDIQVEQNAFVIQIRDNGCGIPEDKKDLIFVPNFTTKSKGTGLGLAMVKNIILNLGGMISFKSEEGKGTIFTIRLPKYEDAKDI